MPTKVVQQQSISHGYNMTAEKYDSQMKSHEVSGEDEDNARDVRARKRLQKSPSDGLGPQSRQEGTGGTATTELRSNFVSRRRPSVRDQKVPLGARPLERSPTKSLPNNNNHPVVHVSASSTVRPLPHSRQASNNNISSFNFGTRALEPRKSIGGNVDSYPFLPAVNFDDFHTSITSVEPLSTNSQRIDSSLTGTTGRVTNSGGSIGKISDYGVSRRSTLAESDVRNGRSGLYVQRQPSITRQKAQSSASSTRIETMGPPSAPTAAKGRRQSHFPTSSTSNNAPARPPRKSIGPGTILTNSSESILLKGRSPFKGEADEIEGHTPTTVDRPTRSRPFKEADAVLAGDQTSFLAIRNAKAKSLHAPPSSAQDYVSTSQLTSENLWSMPFSTTRSPGRSNGQSATPSSSRRLSVMPGHATGLGARTISPTDARRFKRISMMPNPPPLPYTPPVLPADPAYLVPQASVESPSLTARKSETPSSNRTTPDPNRKSYCSVISTSSNTSYNSIRGIGPTPRTLPSASLSRLPTLKSRNENNVNAKEEEVPPVPAIPKAYESPKSELDIPFFTPRKSSLTDAISLNSNSTVDHGGGPPGENDPQVFHRERQGRINDNNVKVDEQADRSAHNNIRNLQPLRLPPLNLLPLSTPTAEKIAALHERVVDSHSTNMTPPPRRGQVKTPSTPLTASKANFFSRNQYSDEYVPMPSKTRSSSSHYALRSESSLYQDASSSSSSVLGPIEAQPDPLASQKAISPFVSSSLPKNGGEFNTIMSKTSTERVVSSINIDYRPSRLTGPRAQTSTKNLILDTNSQPSSPLESEPQSFRTSLRRKLSLTQKQSLSKSEFAAEQEPELPPQPPKHDAMPPPRLPASATWNGPWLSNPNPSHKLSYLSSRRKASGPEAVPRHDHTRAEYFTDGVSDKDPITSAERSAFLQVASRTPSYNGMDSMLKLRAIDTQFDRDDLIAEEQMNQLALRRKDTESAARELDALRQRAVPKEKVSATQALRTARLNIFERGEIVDYKEIYFCGTQTAKKFTGDLEAEGVNFGYDDERGDYNIVNGDHLAYRYEVVDILGKGSFGQVVRCVDHKTGGLVAIKIIRNKKRFHQQALVEVNILQKLREWDPQNKFSMVNFTQSFYFRGHLCISTELLGINLYEFIKIHDFKGFSIKLIRRFTKQLLNSLILLKSHKVIHCDLKPENILLAHPAHSEIKVIDFGSSCLENEKVYTYIQSRFYRSPEVILGMTYGMPIDMWSLGCILAELLTGYPIFPGENEQEQLACIMEVFGPPDKHLIEKSTRKKLFFDSLGKPRLTVSSKGKRRRPSSRTLQQTLKCDDEAFLDFITRCLRWDPDRRMKPDEAASHEFITGIKSTSRSIRSLQSSAPNGGSSPIKRYNSVQTSATTARPLPEPPGTSLKTGAPARLQERQNSGSPSKAMPKRHSTMAVLQNGVGSKKPPNGAMVGSQSSSALPRLSGTRTTGVRPDMASAAAAIATSKLR